MAKLKKKGKRYVLTLKRKEAAFLAGALDVLAVPSDVSKIDNKIWALLDDALDAEFPLFEVEKEGIMVRLKHPGTAHVAPAAPRLDPWRYVDYSDVNAQRWVDLITGRAA